MANHEGQTSWNEFLEKLRERGLRGVQFVVSDDHSGLRKAIREVLAQALWQRCYVHFLHNALDYLPRRADDIPRMGHDIPTSLAKTIADAIGAAASRRK